MAFNICGATGALTKLLCANCVLNKLLPERSLDNRNILFKIFHTFAVKFTDNIFTLTIPNTNTITISIALTNNAAIIASSSV